MIDAARSWAPPPWKMRWYRRINSESDMVAVGKRASLGLDDAVNYPTGRIGNAVSTMVAQMLFGGSLGRKWWLL